MSNSQKGKPSRLIIILSVAAGSLATFLLMIGFQTLIEPRSVSGCSKLAQNARTSWQVTYSEQRCVVFIHPVLVDSELTLPVTPDLLNDREVSRALNGSIPVESDETGTQSVVVAHFLVDETGAVRQQRIAESSGYEPLDEALLAIGPLANFSPAETEDGPTQAWVAVTVGVRTHHSPLQRLRETLERWRDEAEM